MITFDKNKNQESIISPVKPILHIDKIVFNSKDKDWIIRLVTTSLKIKIACIDSNGKELKSYQVTMTFGQFITPQHRQPVLNVDSSVTFLKHQSFHDDSICHNWTTFIEVHNLTLQNDETLNVYLLSPVQIKKKQEQYKKLINNWKQRVSNLYSTIQNWLIDTPEYRLTIGRPMHMYEELMETYNISPEQIDTADLYKSNRLLLTFKPKGLWVIGANGRIDIISQKGSSVLVDYAEHFATPKWHLHTVSNKKGSVPFSKKTLLSIL